MQQANHILEYLLEDLVAVSFPFPVSALKPSIVKIAAIYLTEESFDLISKVDRRNMFPGNVLSYLDKNSLVFDIHNMNSGVLVDIAHTHHDNQSLNRQNCDQTNLNSVVLTTEHFIIPNEDERRFLFLIGGNEIRVYLS